MTLVCAGWLHEMQWDLQWVLCTALWCMDMTGVYACLFEAVCNVTTVPSHLKVFVGFDCTGYQFNDSGWYLHIMLLCKMADTCTPVDPWRWYKCLHWHRWEHIFFLETKKKPGPVYKCCYTNLLLPASFSLDYKSPKFNSHSVTY